MKFLLDTDISSYAIKGDRRVLAKMQQYLTQWAISSVTYHELVEGMLGTKNLKNEKLFAEFIEEVDVIDFGSADAMESGRLSWYLAKAGTPIGEYDTLIAGHALSLNLTLVTNNEKHFSRVPELRISNWMK
jgi:tRNA(fMet)-specific endonuclease VapC